MPPGLARQTLWEQDTEMSGAFDICGGGAERLSIMPEEVRNELEYITI